VRKGRARPGAVSQACAGCEGPAGHPGAASRSAPDPGHDELMRLNILNARRVVVKLGSNLFFAEDGTLALPRIFSLIEDMAAAKLEGRQLIVVSSGAVALGTNALQMKQQSALLAQKQAFAAVGQSRLMNLYEQGFGKAGLNVAQVLLTEEDFS